MTDRNTRYTQQLAEYLDSHDLGSHLTDLNIAAKCVARDAAFLDPAFDISLARFQFLLDVYYWREPEVKERIQYILQDLDNMGVLSSQLPW